jgi:hypothetical protein
VKRNSGTWTAFLAMTFIVVGLTGLFATYATPIPLERALARDAALDEALATEGQPNQAALLEGLRDRLDDSAAAVIKGTGPLAVRIAAARSAMHAELQHEADAIGDRLRFMIIVVTVLGIVFGAVILGAVARS